MDTIFKDDVYRLGPCCVVPLQPDSAGPAAETLAAMDPWLTLGYSPEGLTRYLLRHDPALRRFSVLVSDEPVGLVCVRYPWLLGAYIELIALFSSHQGAGAGRAVVEWIEAQMRPVSRNLWSLVSSFNADARRFYQRLGFSEVAPIPDLVSEGYTEVLLRKSLKAQVTRSIE